MSLESLEAILSKEEIIATQLSENLLHQPQMVENAYLRHVRTYIPLGRQSQNEIGNQTVGGFEKRIIRDIKSAKTLRGYITAEYGNGKTSTALYLWRRACETNILAVPPFQMTRLQDLIIATYGWLKYELERTRPNTQFLSEAEALYQSIMARNAKRLAEQYQLDEVKLQHLIRDRRNLLDLNEADYLRFFDEATDIACRAGFEGLLVLADEVQQYINPEIRTGIKDPISPLFNLVGGLLTRTGQLRFGLIFVLPPQQLDVLRDQRGDLIHRLLQASLDLRTIYDREFPHRLWYRLAQEFDFADHSHRIITDEALESLGQIGARSDLSEGPRTVINIFRHMTRRYIEIGHPANDSYTPYHLIEDCLQDKVFDSQKKIQQVTNQALNHSLVKGYLDRERAVKWAAAFPEEGVPRNLQIQENLEQAFDLLLENAQGDLVISVGDIDKRGITLRGLDRVETATDWLSMTIREFWRRLYHEQIEKIQRRTVKGFIDLLQTKIFLDDQWKIQEVSEAGLTRNDGLMLEGCFRSYRHQYPNRRVHIRILWEDEAVKDVDMNGEFLIQFHLKLYANQSEDERKHQVQPLAINYDNRKIIVFLNLMCRDETQLSPQLDKVLSPIVSPYKLTPSLMLSLHTYLNEKRSDKAIPKTDDQEIAYYFQPELLDNAFRLLFNEEVGRPVEAAQERILEIATRRLLEAMYPEYHTLMVTSKWRTFLSNYKNALRHLETTHERQGQMNIEGTKDEIAKLFVLTNTSLDNFIKIFPALISIEQDFPSAKQIKAGQKGAVRFQRHPLEKKFLKWLTESSEIQRQIIKETTYTVHTLPTNKVYQQARNAGYVEKEIDEILDLMVERGLIVQDKRGLIREEINLAPSIDDLQTEIQAWQHDLNTLRQVFQDRQLMTWLESAQKAMKRSLSLREKQDDTVAIQLRRSLQIYRGNLEDYKQDRLKDFRKEVGQFIQMIPQLNNSQSRNLNTPIQGRVSYVEQINDLRSRLLRQHSTLDNDLDAYRQEAQALASSLQNDDLAIETLVELKNRQQALTELQERADQSRQTFTHFTHWGEVVSLGSALADQIQALGDSVQPQRDQFHQVSQDIMGHLSANKLKALPDAPNFKAQLNEIQEAVRRIKEEANQHFVEQQERYQRALLTELQFPPERLWPSFSYNPADPDDSQRRLVKNVQQSLQELVQRLEGVLAKKQKISLSLQTPSLETMPPDKKLDIEQCGKALLSDCTQLDKYLSLIQSLVQDDAVIKDFPIEIEKQGQFQHLLHELRQALDSAAQITKNDKALQEKVGQASLTPEEQKFLDSLTSDKEVFEQSLAAKNTWLILQGLYIKRRIHISFEPIRYDE